MHKPSLRTAEPPLESEDWDDSKRKLFPEKPAADEDWQASNPGSEK